MSDPDSAKSRKSNFDATSDIENAKRLTSAEFLASEAFVSEQVRVLFAGSPSLLFANFAVAFVFVLVHYSAKAHAVVLVWTGAISVMLLARLGFYALFRTRGHLHAPRFTPGQFNARRWLLGFRLTVLASALCWGLGGVLFLDAGDPIRIAFCILVIGGLCAGSITALSVDQLSSMIFLFVTPLPTLFALLQHGSSTSFALACFFVIGVLFVGLTANRASEAMFELIRLRFETDRNAEQLRTSEQRWKFALEGARQAVWDWDASSRKTFFSSAKWREMVGFEARDTFDSSVKNWRQAMHPEDRVRVLAALDKLVDSGESRFAMDYRYRHRDGRYLWISARGIVVARNANGRPTRVIGANEDVTEDRALREQLQQAQKMQTIGQLAGGVAHDFNNNLTAMMMSLDMLELDPALPASALETVHELGQMTERAAKITAQLLLFARRQSVQMLELDLGEAMQKLAGMLARLIGERVQLSLTLPESAIVVRADAALLDQAIINLAINARDAMPEGGTLKIALDLSASAAAAGAAQGLPNGKFARIRITDTGTGMTEEVMQHLFEPFYTTKAVGKGTGLGLASVHGMAHQHGGWISASSELGVGSEFSLFLPALEAKPLAVSPPALRSTGAISQSQGKHSPEKLILVVEDENMVRDSVVRMLRHLGMQVLAAANAQQALEIWRENGSRIDLLLSDLVMPGAQNGLELATQLRAEAPHLPIIIMSGYSSDGTQGELRQAKALARIQFLAKPFDVATLQHQLALAYGIAT